MKQAINSLFRKGQANVVKIICLSIGLALGLLMIAEVIFERSYDNYIPRLDDTYRVEAIYQMQEGDPKEFNQTAGAIAPGIKNVCPEVEAATRYTWLSGDDETFLTEDNLSFKGNILMTDSSFFDVFPRKILFGEDPHKGLNEVYQAYISDKLLKTVGTDIIGKTVRYKANEAVHFQVVGVFEAFPENTHLPQMDILLSLPTYKLLQGGNFDSANNWLGNDRYRSYVRLAPGVQPEALQGRIDQMVEDHMGEQLKQAGFRYALGLKPVRNLILTASDYNRVMNYVFLAFGIIMLAVSILNYILLVVSSMVNRAKSIATYRCYGADGKDIYKMILSESFLHVVCISLPIAILIMLGTRDIKPSTIDRVAVSSVVPAIMHSVIESIRRYLKIEPLVIGPGTKSGVKIRTANPREVGADLICDVAACLEYYSAPCIVVDFGTVTKYEIIDQDGALMAAVFSPGIGTGLVYGYIGQVQYIVEQIKKEMNLPDMKVIATGGFGRLLAGEIPSIDYYDNELALKGVRLIAMKNKPSKKLGS